METVRRGSPVPVGHAGVQGRDRGARPAGWPVDRAGGQRFRSGGVGVRRWVEPGIDTGQRDGLSSGEREELRELRRDNRRLQADVDVLECAMAFMRSQAFRITPTPHNSHYDEFVIMVFFARETR
jgi:hypothetical protein